MKDLRTIILGLGISIVVFLVLGMSYQVARHSYELTDQVTILGESASIDWQEIEALPEGHGLVVLTPLVASTEILSGRTSPDGISQGVVHISSDNVQSTSLQSSDTIQINSDLVSREIINRFGTQILSWQCSVSGSLDITNEEYYLFLYVSGGGDAGYTVTFAIEDCGNLEFELVIAERLWEEYSRDCRIKFRINKDGTITKMVNS